MSAPSCSIVVRCYNEAKDIGKLLHGLSRQTVDDFELIVVDSGSDDGTLEVLANRPHKLVHIPREMFSFGRALNYGCRAATAPFIVMASAHVFPVYEDWLERLLQPFANPDVALTYGRQVGPATAPFSEQMIFKQWFPDSLEAHDSLFCNNANAAIRSDVWQRLPYDEDLTGLEDLDWAKRAANQGLRTAYVPTAPVVHVHRETSRQTYRRYFREAIALHRIFPGKHFGLLDAAKMLPSTIVHDLREARREKALLKNFWDIPRFRALQVWGAYRGARFHTTLSQALKQKLYYGKRRPNMQPSTVGDQKPIEYGPH